MKTCDYCGENSNHAPILEKPIRFFIDDHTHLLAQAYTDLSKVKR